MGAATATAESDAPATSTSHPIVFTPTASKLLPGMDLDTHPCCHHCYGWHSQGDQEPLCGTVLTIVTRKFPTRREAFMIFNCEGTFRGLHPGTHILHIMLTANFVTTAWLPWLQAVSMTAACYLWLQSHCLSLFTTALASPAYLQTEPAHHGPLTLTPPGFGPAPDDLADLWGLHQRTVYRNNIGNSRNEPDWWRPVMESGLEQERGPELANSHL